MKPSLMLLASGLVLTSGTLFGDEQVRRVQEELRKRNIYFGNIDGRASKETSGAIRRYQERKGFAVTGKLDGDTLRSLRLAPPDARPAAEPWPDVIVLKSDAARDMSEADRKLLEEESAKAAAKTSSIEEPPPVAEPPVAEPPAAEPPAAESGPPERSGADMPAVAPAIQERRRPGIQRPVASDAIAQRAESFVREYLEVAEKNKPEAEMRFYANRVNYFDHGTVSRDFIERDVRDYYQRWPNRDYDLIDFKVTQASPEEVAVRFRINFRVKNAAHSVAGKTTNVFRIRRNGEGMRFVAMKEQRIRK